MIAKTIIVTIALLFGYAAKKSKSGALVQVGKWQAPFIVAAVLLVVGSAVWAFWLDPDKHILTSR